MKAMSFPGMACHPYFVKHGYYPILRVGETLLWRQDTGNLNTTKLILPFNAVIPYEDAFYHFLTKFFQCATIKVTTRSNKEFEVKCLKTAARLYMLAVAQVLGYVNELCETEKS